RRSASELSLIRSLAHAVSETADRLDHVAGNFLPQSADKYFDRVRIAIKILIVKVLDQLRARNDPAIVVHEVSKQPKLVRCQLYRMTFAGYARRLGVEPDRSALDFRFCVPGSPAHLGSDTSQQLFHVEGLCQVIVGAGVHAGHLIAPAV